MDSMDYVQSLNGSSAGTGDRCSLWMGHRDGYLVAGPSVRNTSCLAKGDQNVIQIAMVGQFFETVRCKWQVEEL